MRYDALFELSQSTAAATSCGSIRRFIGRALSSSAASASSPLCVAVEHRRRDNRRTDRVDANVLVDVLDRGGFGETDDSVLARHVGRHVGLRQNPDGRGGVNDRAAALVEHDRYLLLHAQPDALEIDVDDPVPVLLADLMGRRLSRFDAGVVVGHVKPPVCGQRLADHVGYVACLGDVDLHKGGVASAVANDLHRFAAGPFVNVGYDHLGARSSKGQSCGAADACRRPR